MSTTDTTPAVRARSARDLLEYVDVFEPGALARVLDTMPAESRDIIMHTARTGWIPIEHDHFIVDGVVEVFGAARGRDVWRTFLKGHMRNPLFRALFESAVRLFGLTPATVASLAPRAWGQAYRNFGRLELVEKSSGRAVIQILELPPGAFEYPNYLVSFEGTFEGMMHAADTEGQLDFSVDPARKMVQGILTW